MAALSHWIRAASTTVLMCLLASCGGGGGADSSGSGPATATPLTLSALSGSDQEAPPGGTLGDPLRVLVADANGSPAQGVQVTFTVTSGGGHVENVSATTDASGHASPGAWTLGDEVGIDTVTASATGVATVVFSALAENKSSDIAINPVAPTRDVLIGDSSRVLVEIVSTYELTAVSATFGSKTVPLTFGPIQAPTYVFYAWSATLPLGDLASGPGAVIVTALDAQSHRTDLVVTVVLDRVPALDVAAPLDGSVARPGVALSVACSDDDPSGCASMEVILNGRALITAKAPISQSLDLSDYEGQTVTLQFSGYDVAGQRTNVYRTVYVESSSTLSTWAEVEGSILDVAGSRVLYLDTTGTTPALKVYDKATQSTHLVEASALLDPSLSTTRGFLTPQGAIYARSSSNSSYQTLLDWRGGAPADLGHVLEASLRVNGNWALYSAEPGPGDPTSPLWLRDLAGAQSSVVAADAGNTSNDVAANGDVVYWNLQYNIIRVRNAVSQALTSDGSATVLNTDPITDGTAVVYQKTPDCCIAPSRSLELTDGSALVDLVAPSQQVFQSDLQYVMTDGYVAFSKLDGTGHQQAWRFASGQATQVSFFGASSSIEALGSDGAIVFTSSDRYRAAVGGVAQKIGTGLGRAIFRDGHFYILIGRAVLRVEG